MISHNIWEFVFIFSLLIQYYFILIFFLYFPSPHEKLSNSISKVWRYESSDKTKKNFFVLIFTGFILLWFKIEISRKLSVMNFFLLIMITTGIFEYNLFPLKKKFNDFCSKFYQFVSFSPSLKIDFLSQEANLILSYTLH